MSIRIKLSHASGASLAAFVTKPDTPEVYDPAAEAWVGPEGWEEALTPLAADGPDGLAAQVYQGEIPTPIEAFPDGEYPIAVVRIDDGPVYEIVGWSVATVIDGSDAWVEPGGGGGGSGPLPPDAVLSESFASDADLAAAVAPEDWSRLTPDNQVVARGTDGVIAAGGFTLTSATNPDFEARGVQPGMVLRVAGANLQTTDLLTVAGVSGGTLTLRRAGLGTGEGAPPGGSAGVTGLTFEVVTFRRQLATASTWLAALTGIEPGEASAPYTERLRAATVAKVAYDAYSSLTELLDPNAKTENYWSAKAAKFRRDFLAELALILGLKRAAATATATAAGTLPGRLAVGRFETPCDWIVPRAW